ncbi:CHY zinc finger protein [Halobacillus sp. Marseille-Q1614]|uniref:CHY zinc finger protein n=1 Tax=Halobacillus sp. Marseille-Q1614 TaxID=2709134 RepID=UPI001570CC09|nr:CHY zinc finger protein [Halobacillus sp. Marseille-Q1614]
MERQKVNGVKADKQTRCAHYHTEIDVIAIKFYCCKEYYACYYCHEELADHPPSKWPEEQFESKAILCGNCQTELTIQEYMSVSRCPSCHHSFNERCSLHYPLYFDMKSSSR